MASSGPVLTFHGVRGSTPCDGQHYSRYGGNTSSVSLESHGQIIGLPFFTPAFHPDARLTVYGPRQAEGPLGKVFAGVMRPPYFPITPSQLGGDVSVVDVGYDDFALNGAKVTSRWVRHTGPALGFRVDLDGCSVTHISDHGPGCVTDDPDDYVPPGVLELCDGVDVAINDAQHTVEEYEAKRHFGHSSIDYAVHGARKAGVRRLVLFHHCPTHSDDDIDRIFTHAQDLSARRDGPEIVVADEGLALDLGGEQER
jgi:ribonuclease BN (tRNA processing enzyme)